MESSFPHPLKRTGVTLAVTACVETLLGEPSHRRLTALGVALVCCGATLCTLST